MAAACSKQHWLSTCLVALKGTRAACRLQLPQCTPDCADPGQQACSRLCKLRPASMQQTVQGLRPASMQQTVQGSGQQACSRLCRAQASKHAADCAGLRPADCAADYAGLRPARVQQTVQLQPGASSGNTHSSIEARHSHLRSEPCARQASQSCAQQARGHRRSSARSSVRK